MLLLDSNIIIYSAKREYAELRRFMARNVYSVSAISRIEVLGYHLLRDEQRQYLTEFFRAANILSISDSVVTKAVKLRHRLRLVTRNMGDFSWIQNLDLTNPFESEVGPESS